MTEHKPAEINQDALRAAQVAADEIYQMEPDEGNAFDIAIASAIATYIASLPQEGAVVVEPVAVATPLQAAIDRFECAVFTWTRTLSCEQTQNYRAEMDAARAALVATFCVGEPVGWRWPHPLWPKACWQFGETDPGEVAGKRPVYDAVQGGGEVVGWNCTYPSYGHITLKKHEAEQARHDGAIVRPLVYGDEIPSPAGVDAVQGGGEVVEEEDWRDDPSSDERWEAGCDFALDQLCKALGVDPREINWDAATETLDGDVRAVIGNVIKARFGENWQDLSPSLSPDATKSAVLAEREACLKIEPGNDEVFHLQRRGYCGGWQDAVDCYRAAIRVRPAP